MSCQRTGPSATARCNTHQSSSGGFRQNACENRGLCVQEPFQKALLTGKTAHAAWRSKPSFYAVSTEDRTINPDLEHLMAKRMGAKTIEVKSSHLSLISHPDEITRLILEAAGQPVVS